MSRLDADAVRAGLGDPVSLRLAGLEAFSEISSTNSYLMECEAPGIGGVHVAMTDNQTAGRGRHGRTWQSPAGSGLCLSLAYTFAKQPSNLAALTLAIGISIAEVLDRVGVTDIRLKWPNDLLYNDAKLGGILTEAQAPRRAAITVVTGVGINLDLGDQLTGELERPVTDLRGITGDVPDCNRLAARLVDGICETFLTYESSGFSAYSGRWPQRDWLLGRDVTVTTPQQQIAGKAAGVADNGALLVDSGSGVLTHVTSGTVLTGSNEESVA